VRKVVQGQRVTFGIGPGGLLIPATHELIRAEDPAARLWTVNLSPITRAQVGADVFGQPGRRVGFAPGDTGNLGFVMTWGAGGVTFKTQIAQYPVNGASFAVAGDNMHLEVFTPGNATVFTADSAPSVVGWAQQSAAPTAYQPLITELFAALPFAIDPWCRALWVARDTALATVAVTFTMANLIPILIALPPDTGMARIPVPNGAEQVMAVASAGVVVLLQELAFT